MSMVDGGFRQKITMLSTEVLDLSSSASGEGSDVRERSYWLPFVDNASLRCPTSDDIYSNNGVCQEDSMQKLVWRLLYWIKRIVLRLARSYHADMAVLLLLPLVTGILIGFWIAKSNEKGRQISRSGPWAGFLLACCPAFVMRWIYEYWHGQSLVQILTEKDETLDVFSKGRDKNWNISIASQSNSQRPSLVHLLQTADGTTEAPMESFPQTQEQLSSRENLARGDLRSERDTKCESGIAEGDLPRHVAFIMDGNRRYGRKKYGNTVAGHWDGSRKVLDVAKWCIAEKIPFATVYAFSTENWKRDSVEVSSLMEIFAKYCEELRQESLERNIRVRILSTDPTPIPPHVAAGLQRLENDTATCTGLCLNVCLSYGSRSEMTLVCRKLVNDCLEENCDPSSIGENEITERLLTNGSPDPDILIRTSGEMRMSNYLLWQLAYAELFFLEKNWPELEKDDFLNVLRSFSLGRKRRFGK